jgi:glucose-6-phosphate 1-epimerase
MNWYITDSEVTEGNPAVTLELKDDSYSRSMWDYSFQAVYKVNSVIVFRLQLQIYVQ